MQKLLKSGLIASVLLTPVISFAAANSNSSGIKNLLITASGVISDLTVIIIALAVLVFLWGVLQYVIAKDEDKQKEARSVMLYGIIAIFVMVSVAGLVNLLGDSLDLNKTPLVPPSVPTIK
jgi:uncharacterized membrane protein SpoIIM required for sporulation